MNRGQEKVYHKNFIKILEQIHCDEQQSARALVHLIIKQYPFRAQNFQ